VPDVIPDDRPFICRLCGLRMRGDDAIVEVGDELFHAPCAEASWGEAPTWRHTDVTTLSQWARGSGWAGGLG
jgi:hypothetical protein